ncbi:MAG: hypothetical protein NVS3B7_09400 [Candidatus Elarobacter sp.]
MVLLIVMVTVIFVGIAAIALAQPRQPHEIVVWNDETERRILRERTIHLGRW